MSEFINNCNNSTQCWYCTTKEVIQRTGLSKSTIDRLEHNGKFPCRVQISVQRIGWLVEEVEAWRVGLVKRRKLQKVADWDEIRKKAKVSLSPRS